MLTSLKSKIDSILKVLMIEKLKKYNFYSKILNEFFFLLYSIDFLSFKLKTSLIKEAIKYRFQNLVHFQYLILLDQNLIHLHF